MEIDQSTSKYAEKVSSLIKELAFVGIAIIWLFKTIKEESILLDEDLLISIFALISAVSSQFMQFLSQSLICAYYSYKNKVLVAMDFMVDICYWLCHWIFLSNELYLGKNQCSMLMMQMKKFKIYIVCILK